MSEIPVCYSLCKHYSDDRGRSRCQAFPDGIPIEILACEVDHLEPYPGDNGIRFEAKPERKPRAVNR